MFSSLTTHNTTSTTMLLITSIDEYLGYCIASHLAQFKPLRKDLRVLYHVNHPWIKNFESKGVDTHLIKDYNNPNDLSHAMRNVDQMILTLDSHRDRVQHAISICNVAIKSGVKSIIFLSHIGAQSEHHVSLYDYGMVENYLIGEEDHMAWTILRLDWIQQFFHLWASQVDQTRTMALPLSLEAEICPIDISDVCHTITSFVLKDPVAAASQFLDRLHDNHVGQVYTLTGPEALTSKEILQMMSNATSYEGFKYHMARPMDISFYLRTLSHNIWFDARLKNEKLQLYRDLLECESSYRSKALFAPNDIQIQGFIDYFDWVTKTSGSIPVDHIKQFAKEPKTMQHFFVENANSFKPRV